MLRNKLYYLLKPVLPWHLRVGLRRRRAERRRAAYADVWPIDHRAGNPPPGWPGWPDGKQFALVLTHDVEWSKGLRRVERLMQLEVKHGFRSAFNLIPEREYRVPAALREAIDRAGFEVGVHGLKHDGKLYSSKQEFASRAARIREYMQEWNASGFRSPLMHHNLSWQHLLGAEYDSSTFDTDPFEPEPDGVGTIFPFWVPGPEGTGFVELPYTLVQDFSLFIVLRETNIDIWKHKLDWIASRGGMALINTHPDYMSFEGEGDQDEFPVSFYEEFLQYARDKYQNAFWHALPRAVSRYYVNSLPPNERNTRKKICALTYSNYENDTRVRRYAETLARRGDAVDVIAITNVSKAQLGEMDVNGVRVLRIQHRENNETGKWSYALRLLRFFLCASIALARRHREKRYDVIHVHNIPDFLVFAGFYPKLSGAGLILDIHDLVPELFANKFDSGSGGFYACILRCVEKASAAFADHVIIANHLWEQKVTSRSVPARKCSVFLNHIDSEMFYRRERTRSDSRFIIVFPGTWQWHQGLDIAIEGMAHLKEALPEAELHLYGGGGGLQMEGRLRKLADSLGLNGRVKFCGNVSLSEIAQVIADSDVGIVPKRADSFGNEAYSTKIMEFMSQGLPVVASRTKIDAFYFDETQVRFFPSGNSRALADAILTVKQDLHLRQSLVDNGLKYAAANSWEHRRRAYLDLVDSLSTARFDGDLRPSPGAVSTSFREGEEANI